MKILLAAWLIFSTVEARAADAPASQPSNLNFDLLGPENNAPPPAAEDSKVKVRRVMLQLHQGFGFVLLALSAGAAITGQLNYSDRFLGPSTGKYEVPHAIFAYSTFGMFFATGALAVFAPSPLAKERAGIDRITVHKIGMYGAAAGMVLEVVLGILTTKNEGYAVQQQLAVAHLVNGYTTFALMTAGVSALIF